MKKLNLFLLLAFFVNFAFALDQGKNTPFGGPGITPHWSNARKNHLGTFFESNKKSLVWFTSAQGILTEVYFPTIDKAQIRDGQILVSDGKSFLIEEKKDTNQSLEYKSSSEIVIKNSDKKNRFKITHNYFTLEDQSTLIDEVEINVYQDNLKFYLLVNPSLNNSGHKDSGRVEPSALHFFEGKTNLWVQSSIPFIKSSMGYEGTSDGYQDLIKDFKLDYEFESIENGNISAIAQLDLPAKKGKYNFYIIYSFDHPAKNINQKKLITAKTRYNEAWSNYLSTLEVPNFGRRELKDLYLRSFYALRAMEDKLHPGAFIASLSIPWGDENPELEHTGGYHLVWPRDLFHIAFALLLGGDTKKAIDALDFLKRIQYQSGNWEYGSRVINKLGSFPQNVWVNGKEYWGNLQIDQVGYPIHLFYQIYLRLPESEKKPFREKYRSFLVSALNFIKNNGPWTAQERWEENFGISPSSFSVVTSALLMADKIFENEEWTKAMTSTANAWLFKKGDNIHTWTFTTQGKYGKGEYYVRVSGCADYMAVWDPNNNQHCKIATSNQWLEQTQIVDQGFLQLSLLGLVPANDYKMIESWKIANQYLAVKTPTGTSWYRYTFDAYGENKKGRLWPILNGEQGRFWLELLKHSEFNRGYVLAQASLQLDQMFNFANDGLFIPEQIFEKSGLGTGSATPLAWSHAEFIKLFWSMYLKKNVENPF